MAKKSATSEIILKEADEKKRSVSIWLDLETIDKIDRVIARGMLSRLKDVPKNRSQLIHCAIAQYLKEDKNGGNRRDNHSQSKN